MPNPLIYASTTPDHSLHKGDVAVGVNSVEYDPSDGWYNGAIPTDWDYVIYKTTSGANPNIFAPANEQEFYNFVLMQGGSASDVTSVGAALAWIATQSDLLALHSSLPNIVTDGLVLALNAGDVSSYPTTGNTWYDLSGEGNATSCNAFNYNGEFFFSAGSNPSQLTFSTPNSTTISNTFSVTSGGWVIEELIRIDDTTYPESAAGTVVSSRAYGSNETGFDWQHGTGNLSQLNVDMSNLNTGGAASRDAEVNLAIDTEFQVYGKWILRSIYWDRSNDVCGVYYNGKFQDSGSISGVSGYSLYDGGGISWGTLYGWTHDGARALMRVYNKLLTDAEVLQNYYQAPIVTDGLVFAVDAGNLVSYESGSTTTYSMTGSDSGSLTNGVGFDSANGGYWDFDGTNDYISLSPSSIPTGNEISISFWNNGDSFASSTIIAASLNNSDQTLNIHLPWSNKNIYWDCGYPFNRINKLATDAEILGWHNWVFTKNATTGNMSIYLDGVLWHSGSGLTSSIPSMTVATLGSYFTPQLYHNGQIAQCLIHNKALTADEVSQNFQAQSSRFI